MRASLGGRRGLAGRHPRACASRPPGRRRRMGRVCARACPRSLFRLFGFRRLADPERLVRSPPRGLLAVLSLGEETRGEGVDRAGHARVHVVLAGATEDVGGEDFPGRVVELDTRAPQDLEHVGVVVGARQGHAVLLQLLFVPGRGAGGGRGRRRERRGRLRRRIHAACGARGRSRPWSTGETEGRCIARGGHRERAARARVCRLGPAKKTHKIIKSFLVGTKNGYKESNPALLFLSSHVHRGVVERAAHRGFMMPAVYPDRLTTRAVPQPRAGVRRSSDQIRGINTEDAIPANKTRRQPLIAHTVTIIKLNLPHPPLVPLERPLQLEPVEVPQLHRLIGTRRGQQSAIRG